MIPIVNVTCAIMIEDRRVFIARRAPNMDLGGKWEFPGGKMEPDESPRECLAREMMEEFGITVEVGEFFGMSDHEHRRRIIRLSAYRVTRVAGEVVPAEHDAVAWVEPERLTAFDLAEADIVFAERLAGLSL